MHDLRICIFLARMGMSALFKGGFQYQDPKNILWHFQVWYLDVKWRVWLPEIPSLFPACPSWRMCHLWLHSVCKLGHSGSYMALQADIPFFVLRSKRAVIVAGLLLFRVGTMSLFGGVGTIQFSSVQFDNPGNAEPPIHRRFSCRSQAPLWGVVMTSPQFYAFSLVALETKLP